MGRIGIAIALLLFSLGACSSEGTSPPPELAPGRIDARFPPGGAVDVIEVTMRDRVAARSVALVGPTGLAQPAYALEAAPQRSLPRQYGDLPASASPQLGIRGAPTTTSSAGEIVTTAYIRVPDVIDYRRNWRDYRIRIEFGSSPGALRAAEVPAPPPG